MFEQDDKITSIIEEAVEDATQTPTDVPEVEATEVPDAPVPSLTDVVETVKDEPTDVPSKEPAPPVAEPTPAEDEFAKKYGIQAETTLGRENRIPYSRVKKIVEKAAGEREAFVRKDFETKGWLAPEKATEFTTKLQDYEEKFQQVRAAEKTIEQDVDRTLAYLETLPAWQPFFDTMRQLWTAVNGNQPAAPAADPMPQPGPDGFYDTKGLDDLLEWKARQVETRIDSRWKKQYEDLQKEVSPVVQRHKADEYMAQLQPYITQQLDEAYKKPRFKEFESEIAAVMAKDDRISIDAAYNMVVVPHLVSDENTMRARILAEMKKAPVSTAVRGTPSKVVEQHTGQRDLEDVIRDSIKGIKG